MTSQYRLATDYVSHSFNQRDLAETDFETEKPSVLHPEDAYPLGSNNLSLGANFNQRLKYKNAKYFEGLPKPIDTFYDKVFYGKVDRLQNVIVPKRPSKIAGVAPSFSRLKQISEKNVFALDFVADNFSLFKRNMKIAVDQRWINSNDTNLADIEGRAAWFDYEPSYRKGFQFLIDVYNQSLYQIPKKEFNKIKTFEDYVSRLEEYLLSGAYTGPVTLTEMVLSHTTSPNISGLAIEIEKKSYSSDLPKYINYFEDINFSYYVRAARKFGFYVDKNGPWRIFADLFSPPMLEVLRDNYGIGKYEVFDTYYDRTYTLDLDLLKRGLKDAWNKFADTNNRIIESVSDTGARCARPYFQLQGGRSPVDESYINKLSNMYWFGLYISIRSVESGIIYKNKHFLTRQAVNVENAYRWASPGQLGYRGLLYINNLFKPYLYDERLFKKHLTSSDESVIVGSVLDTPTVYVGI